MNVDERVTLMCAFRYALGRMTYAVSCVSNHLIENWDNFKPSEQEVIVREIKEAIKNNNIGMDCDKRQWERILLLEMALRETKESGGQE